jgi:hypothetical protein
MNVARSVYVSILKQYGLPKGKISSLPEYQAVERMVRYSSTVRGNS